MKNNLGAAILFGHAKAHVEEILALIDQYNEIASSLRDMGYVGAADELLREGEVPDLILDTGNMRVDDASLLDEAWEYGPTRKETVRIRRSGSSLGERNRLGKECGWKCFYCGQVGTSDKGPDDRVWHVDHVYPVARGGDDQPDNRVLACATCNLDKKAKSALEYFRSKLTA